METKDTQNKRKKHDANTSFARVPKRAYFDTELNVFDLAVLSAICSFINSETNSWHMSRPAIAGRAKMKDLPAIDKCVKKLEALQYIEVVKGGKGKENTYTVNFITADALEPVSTKKKTRAKSEPEISDSQFAISHWTAKAKQHNMKHSASDRDVAAVKKLLKQYSLENLQSLMTFVWDVWEEPEPNIKARMDINILLTGYAQGIMNSYEQYKIKKLNRGAVTRELGAASKEAAATMSTEKKNTPVSADDTNKSNPPKNSKIFV